MGRKKANKCKVNVDSKAPAPTMALGATPAAEEEKAIASGTTSAQALGAASTWNTQQPVLSSLDASGYDNKYMRDEFASWAADYPVSIKEGPEVMNAITAGLEELIAWFTREFDRGTFSTPEFNRKITLMTINVHALRTGSNLRNEALKKRDEALMRHEQALHNRDELIARQEFELKERDELILEQKADLKAYGDLIPNVGANLNKLTAKHEAELKSYKDVISRQKERLRQSAELIAKHESALRERTAAIEDLEEVGARREGKMEKLLARYLEMDQKLAELLAREAACAGTNDKDAAAEKGCQRCKIYATMLDSIYGAYTGLDDAPHDDKSVTTLAAMVSHLKEQNNKINLPEESSDKTKHDTAITSSELDSVKRELQEAKAKFCKNGISLIKSQYQVEKRDKLIDEVGEELERAKHQLRTTVPRGEIRDDMLSKMSLELEATKSELQKTMAELMTKEKISSSNRRLDCSGCHRMLSAARRAKGMRNVSEAAPESLFLTFQVLLEEARKELSQTTAELEMTRAELVGRNEVIAVFTKAGLDCASAEQSLASSSQALARMHAEGDRGVMDRGKNMVNEHYAWLKDLQAQDVTSSERSDKEEESSLDLSHQVVELIQTIEEDVGIEEEEEKREKERKRREKKRLRKQKGKGEKSEEGDCRGRG